MFSSRSVSRCSDRLRVDAAAVAAGRLDSPFDDVEVVAVVALLDDVLSGGDLPLEHGVDHLLHLVLWTERAGARVTAGSGRETGRQVAADTIDPRSAAPGGPQAVPPPA